MKNSILDCDCSDTQWLRSEDGIPHPTEVIEVADRVTGGKWLVLDTYTDIHQSVPLGEERHEVEHREMWWMVDAFLIDAGDANTIAEWAQTRKVGYFDRSEMRLHHDMMYGEYPRQMRWFMMDANDFEKRDSAADRRDLPVRHSLTSAQYPRDSGTYDCSLEDAVNIKLPSPAIIAGLGLNGRTMDGGWHGQDSELMVFDPSVNEPGPSALLAKRDRLVAWLNSKQLTLAWLFRGEKQVVGGDASHGKWPGRLLFQGAFVLRQGEVAGRLRTWFSEPGVRADTEP